MNFISPEKDPRQYMKFRQISNTINGPFTCEEKLIFLLEYLPVVVKDLEYGKSQITKYVPRFNELGLFMAKSSKDIFEVEIPKLLVTCSVKNLDINNVELLLFQINKNLKEFTSFLEKEVPKLEVSSFSLGKEAYNKMLKYQLLLDYNDETLWEFGWKEFNNTLKKWMN